MEGTMKRWKEEEEAEVEEESLVKRQAHHHMHLTSTTITNSKLEVQATEQRNGSFGLKQEQEIVDSGDIEKKTNLHHLDPVIHVDSTLFGSVRAESKRVGKITENVQLEKELYLEGLYQKASTQGFYCPNCRTCIQKVLLLEEISAPPPLPSPFICSSCFSFLIPLGSWLFPGWIQDDKRSTIPEPQQPLGQHKHDMNDSKMKPSLGGLMFGAQKKDDIDVSKKPEQPLPLKEVRDPEGSTELPLRTEVVPSTQSDIHQESLLEILKSIVYGGLIESIASLGIVTSSASSDATTLNILVLSLANLIGGLFIIVHNLWDLKSKQPRTNSVDPYYHMLGQRQHFYLHVFIAILSFIIFGLVPPLVYAFTFTGSNNKDLKLAAVAVASAICITLVSIAKAYIQRPNSNLTYLKTVLQYLSTGAMTSIISYLAGELVKKLIEKLGWFDTKGSSFTLFLPEMRVEKPRFGSY